MLVKQFDLENSLKQIYIYLKHVVLVDCVKLRLICFHMNYNRFTIWPKFNIPDAIFTTYEIMKKGNTSSIKIVEKQIKTNNILIYFLHIGLIGTQKKGI